MPLLEPNPGDATAPRSYVQLSAQTPSMLARFACSNSQSHPLKKNPGSANAQTDGHTRLRYVDIVYITVGCPSVCPFVCLFIYSPIHIKKQNTTSQDTYTLKRIKQLSGLNGQHCPGDNSCRSIHICRRHKSASTSWQRQCCDPRRIDTKY